MTVEEAKANIGKPFLVNGFSKWDVIKEVNDLGTVIGEFSEAHAEGCRLKQLVPHQFQKNTKPESDKKDKAI